MYLEIQEKEEEERVMKGRVLELERRAQVLEKERFKLSRELTLLDLEASGAQLEDNDQTRDGVNIRTFNVFYFIF